MNRPCKECWDPVDEEGAQLCNWYRMTPEQQAAGMRRILLRYLAAIILLVGAIWLAFGGAV